MRGVGAIAMVLAPLATGCLEVGVNDGLSPVVVIVSPTGEIPLSGTVTIQMDAADETGLDRVTLSIDNAARAEFTERPYQYVWDTTAETDGVHLLTVVAEDGGGNTATALRAVTVQNRPPSPIPGPTLPY